MPCAHVQTTSAFGDDVLSVTTPDIITTSGNLLHFAQGIGGAVNFSGNPQDSKTNTWIASRAVQTTTDVSARSHHAVNITGGSGHNFTVTLNDNNWPQAVVHEISGAKLSDVLGNTNGATTEGAASLSSGNVAQATNGEILCGWAVSGSTTGAWTPDSDYDSRLSQAGTVTAVPGVAAGTRETATAETNDFTGDPANSVPMVVQLVSYLADEAPFEYASGLMLTPGKFTWD